MSRHENEHRTADEGRAATGGAAPTESPTDLPKRSWWGVLKRTTEQFKADSLSDVLRTRESSRRWTVGTSGVAGVPVLPEQVAHGAGDGLHGALLVPQAQLPRPDVNWCRSRGILESTDA